MRRLLGEVARLPAECHPRLAARRAAGITLPTTPRHRVDGEGLRPPGRPPL